MVGELPEIAGDVFCIWVHLVWTGEFPVLLLLDRRGTFLALHRITDSKNNLYTLPFSPQISSDVLFVHVCPVLYLAFFLSYKQMCSPCFTFFYPLPSLFLSSHYCSLSLLFSFFFSVLCLLSVLLVPLSCDYLGIIGNLWLSLDSVTNCSTHLTSLDLADPDSVPNCNVTVVFGSPESIVAFISF